MLKYKIEGLPTKDPFDKKTPIVIEFRFSPFEWYEKGTYNFGFLNTYNNEFAEFVFHNRVRNIFGEEQHEFDLIFGVMSDNLPTVLIQKYKANQITREEVIEGLKKSTSNKQISLHNQDLCDKIAPARAYFVQTGEELNIDEYYTNRG